MIKEKLKKAIQKVTGASDIGLEVPEREEHGDYTTNFVMQMFAKTPKLQNSKTPRELAEEIANKLREDNKLGEIVEKIEIAGPGFINFWLARTVLVRTIQDVINSKDKYGTVDTNKEKKVMFEYGQPNTHKLPHVGHLFSYIYGESMARILEASGWTLKRANYQGDVGPQIAKILWSYKKENPTVPGTLEEKVDLLQKMYQKGSKAYEEDEEAKNEIDELNIKIYKRDKSIVPIWEKTRKWSLDYYKEFEKRLGINYDRYYFESEVSKKGKEKVKALVGKVFKESQGAIIFEGSKYGLHDRVFITKNDTPTYEAKDFYLAELKMKNWTADLLVFTTAREQNEYFKVLFKALELAHPRFKGKLKHIGFGMVSLKSGKLSSRKGEILGAVELVDTVVDRVRGLSDSQEIGEIVGMGAVKYSFLKNNPLQDVAFDIEESIKEEGNSGPYLQYTTARANSVLRKSEFPTSKFQFPKNYNFNIEELTLMRTFVHFPEAIYDAAENFSPNLIANYLYDLAQKYNTFYNSHRIIDPEVKGKQSLAFQAKRQEVKDFRIALTAATSQILKNGLQLLGIDAPKKM